MVSRWNRGNLLSDGNLKQVFTAAMELLLQLTPIWGVAFLLVGEGGGLRRHLSLEVCQGEISWSSLDLVLETFGQKVLEKGTMQYGKGNLRCKGQEGIVYLLGSPITLAGQKVGILVTVGNAGRQFNKEEKAIFRRVINHLERVLRTAELAEAALFAGGSPELTSLSLSVQHLKFSLDLRELFVSVAELLALVVDYDACFLLLPEGCGERFRSEVLRTSLLKQQLRPYCTACEGILSQVWGEGRPLLCGDIGRDPRFADCDCRDAFGAVMAAPVVAKGEKLGILMVGSIKPESFDREDLGILCSFAAQMGVLYELAAKYTFWEGYQHHLIESVPAAVISVNRRGYVTTFNRGAESLTGLKADRVTGSHYRELLARLEQVGNFSELQLDLEEIVSGALQEGKSYSFWDLHVSGRDSRGLRVNLNLFPIRHSSGRILGATAVIEDITEKRELEASLRQAEKLAALGELAAGVAHEMRNPLTAVKGFTQLLQQRACSAEERASYTQVMLEEIERMEQIIHSLLLLTNSACSQMELLDLNRFLRSLVPLIRAEASLQDVEVVLNLSPCLPPVRVEPREMEQAFLNIVANALQTMTFGGILTISTEYRPQEGEVWIEFTDTGCGIDPADYSRIFNPFFTTKEEGMGLGLPVTYQIVQRHGGEVQVTSRVGEGTTFTIKLPVPPDANNPTCQRKGGERVADHPGS